MKREWRVERGGRGSISGQDTPSGLSGEDLPSLGVNKLQKGILALQRLFTSENEVIRWRNLSRSIY